MNKEFQFVKKLVQSAPRSPDQLNSFYLSDAEVLKVGTQYLCTSVDTISEEITLGLVRDPKSLGWLSAIVSFSDLAALGVATQSLSITLVKPAAWGTQSEAAFKTGLNEACNHYNVQLVEYQSLDGKTPLITSTAASLVNEKPHLFRTSLKEGDSLYLTGPLGLGNAVAFANVAIRSKAPHEADKIDKAYRPQARIKETSIIHSYAHACIDTSDGGLFSFDLLATLNHVGIEIDYNKKMLHPLVQQIASQAQVNPFIFFAAQNGEFELLFAISADKESDFLSKAQESGHAFIKAGRVVKSPGLYLYGLNHKTQLDMSSIQNMLFDRTSPDQYILALLKFASFNKIEAQ